jgi:hypothetical protein
LRFCFDIDGTICLTRGRDYTNAIPLERAVQEINNLYALGHYIILFTARGSGTGMDYSQLTRKQLHDWKVSYHELLFGKPFADVYIDDKALNGDVWNASIILSNSKFDYEAIIPKFHL